MSRRDLFLVASTAAISSFLTYLICASTAPPPVAERYEIGAANGNGAALSNYPGDKAIRIEPGTAGSGAVVASRRDESSIANAIQSADSAAPDPALAFQKQREARERFSGLFNSGEIPDTGVLNAKIESRFYLEEWNQEWAGSKESNIRKLFEVTDNLSGIEPLQVTCRSKNCQVVLSAPSQDQIRLLSDKFMQAATKGDVGMKNKVVSFFPDISMGRVVFYLSENGNMDLFQ